MSSRPQSAVAKYENYDLTGNASTPTQEPTSTRQPAANGSSHVEIYVRVRPVPTPSHRLAWDDSENKLDFNIPRDVSAGLVNNQREHYEFRFNGIIGPQAKQDEVFERVARNVVLGALEGYNGTIFAYGQTGSGKTFTITGGPMHYADRGIIPRTISTIFSEVSKRSDQQISVHVSYLEIYNEIGYDLLDQDREIKAMEDLQQVHVLEDDEGGTAYKNLNVHRVNNEEEALNLLFLGDTNRTISETPMNMASSRSHCIFTIHIEARKHGEETVRRSKLNLVDLAGSERASKTGIDGTTLREAKYINLSLHYLEQVIVALQERSMGMSRPHIPYRNSKMTQVLRDSLGGNCRTVMVATVSADQAQLDESISTCRFAMRVALVRNVIAVNEDVDPALVIRRLKQEIKDLKEEIRLLQGGGEDRGPLTPDELSRLQEQIEAYCGDPSPEAALNFGGSMMHIRATFGIFKRLIVSGGGLKLKQGGGNDTDLSDQVKKLKLQVAQRDNEINILVGMIKRRDQAAANGITTPGVGTANSINILAGSKQQVTTGADTPTTVAYSGIANSNSSSAAVTPLSKVNGDVNASDQNSGEALLNAALLADRNQAFELFRKSYRQNEVIEANKAELRVKYEAAKALGATVTDAKTRINGLRAVIEQRRIQHNLAGLSGASADASNPDAEEERCKAQIEKEKVRYTEGFEKLKTLKSEIEALHMILEKSRARLQHDFEQWMVLMKRQGGAVSQPAIENELQGSNTASTPTAIATISNKSPMQSQSSFRVGITAQGSQGQLTSTSTPINRPGSASYSPASYPVKAVSDGRNLTGRSSTGILTSPTSEHSQSQSLRPSQLLHNQSLQPPRQAWGEATPATNTSSQIAVGSAQQLQQPVSLDFSKVDPQIMAAARPYLTGDPTADQDIVGFYIAKHNLLTKLQAGAAT